MNCAPLSLETLERAGNAVVWSLVEEAHGLCPWVPPPMLGELAEGEALAGLALLPGFWSSTGAETNVPCKGGKVWTKIDDKWRERKIIPEGKGMHKCRLQGGKSR